MSDAPFIRSNLREQIKDVILQRILDGAYEPGARLVETRIAQELGVSQAPVREALRDLDLLGFVVSSPFRGAIVRQISVEESITEANEIYRLACFLLGREKLVSRPLRLLGLGVSNLREPSGQQLAFL